MRIIVAHDYYKQPGGEETAFHSEVELLRAHGHEVTTYTRSNEELDNISALEASVDTIWARQSAKDIGELLKTTQADLIHFHNTFLRISPSAYYAAKAHGTAVVQTLHNYRLICPVATFVRDGQRCEDCVGKTPPWPALLHGCWRGSRIQTGVVVSMLTTHRLLQTWTKKVDKYIAISEFSRQKFIQGGLPAEKIAVKPNFVQRTSLGAENQGDYALFVGRLSLEKGVLPLLEAWEYISQIPLKIVGDGPMRDLVAKAASDHKQIEWLGFQPKDKIMQLMSKALVLVFPTIRPEGLGLSGLEALSVGLPIVAPHLGIMPEMIKDGRTGLLFDPRDAMDLAEKITWAHQHMSSIRAMREECLKSYDQNWSPERNYQILMDIYQQALATSLA